MGQQGVGRINVRWARARTEKGKHMKVKSKIRVSRMICGY